ncbi:glutamate racemase [Marixanthomonas sp. SCSIO 43207]|uniref:glutamate racemase n=1 Tax=Marixanthomonas sp. SCSIO 43207 TaxID=2779360 RepID=UPI001CA90F95|nr:glutamate racemase [Marixanthomonas sp. SCSIO 43207]UAB81642.1 glutamate racemase [Marixanthomonas sp. SCSIO 43207]
MNKYSPIGVFDSGVGGSSIWKEIHQLLPNENTIYLADSKNAPYGNKTQQHITELSLKNTQELINRGCKIVVVACNTATTNAISVLREKFSIPIIGIEPAIKPAALQTKHKSIGILATKGTLSSDLFHKTAGAFAKDISVIEIVGEGLVPLIENGELDSQEMTSLLKKYTAPMIAENIDYLVLGCSHYPYLIPRLKKMLPQHVTIIDSGQAVARQTKNILQQENVLNDSKKTPKLQFFTNTSVNTLQYLLQSYSEKTTIQTLDF